MSNDIPAIMHQPEHGPDCPGACPGCANTRARHASLMTCSCGQVLLKEDLTAHLDSAARQQTDDDYTRLRGLQAADQDQLASAIGVVRGQLIPSLTRSGGHGYVEALKLVLANVSRL